MKVRKWLAILLVMLVLTGCSAASGGSADSMTMENGAPGAMDGTAGAVTGSGTGSTALAENHKWIITVNMTVETDDMDAMLTGLDEQIAAHAGYVEDQNIYNGSSYYSGYRYRSASLTVRVPADQVDAFVAQVDGISNVVSQSRNTEDVTLTYVSIESRMNALLAEEERLLELMEQANTMSDLLEIEARLTDVRYELENITSQLRVLENRVDYATIYLTIEEVQVFTETEEKTVWQRIGSGFMTSLKDIGSGAVEFVIWFLANIPYLVLFGGVAAVVILIVKKKLKKRNKSE